MAIPARLNRSTSHDLAVIAVRVLDDAHMTWVVAEVDSEHALRAWLDRTHRKVQVRTWHTGRRSTARRRQRVTCSGCLS
jgi:hypothetical protein